MRCWQMRGSGGGGRAAWGRAQGACCAAPASVQREAWHVLAERGSRSWEGGVWEPIWCQIIKNLGGCSEELLCPPAFHSERRQTAEGLVPVTLWTSHPTAQVLMPPACISEYVDVQHKDCSAALLEVSGRRFAPRKRFQQASPKSKGARLHNHSCISALMECVTHGHTCASPGTSGFSTS